MNAHAYDVVRLLHMTADLVFAAGLLAGLGVVAALAFESPGQLGRHGALVARVRRLNRRVTGPALVLAWLLGLGLAHAGGWFTAGWLQAKLALVLLLSAQHGATSRALRLLAAEPPRPPSRLWLAGLPLATGLLAAVVWLATIKPA